MLDVPEDVKLPRLTESFREFFHSLVEGIISNCKLFLYTLYILSFSRYANMSELLKAVEAENFQEVKRLIKSGTDVNERSLYQNLWHETALHTAVRSGSLEMVRYLVEHGADINFKIRLDGTPLHLAVHCGSLEVVKYLVEHGAKVTREECRGWRSLLWWACLKRNHVIVDYLLQHGAIEDMNNTKVGSSPLYEACWLGHTKVVQTLLKYNVDIRKERELRCPNDEIINILKHELKKSIKHREKIKILETMDKENMVKVMCLGCLSIYGQVVSVFCQMC